MHSSKQTFLPQPINGEDRVIMKITGVLAELLVEIDPSTYGPYLQRNAKGTPILYVIVVKAIYGTLVAALLWYKKLRKDLEDIGYTFNPYDPCVCNKQIAGNQHTVRFHVDDTMSSHVDPEVNTNFYNWANKKYGKFKKLTVTRGKVHDYLGMTIDFSDARKSSRSI